MVIVIRYGRYEVLAGFVNAIFLVFVGFSVVIEGLERLFTPPEIHGDHLLTVAVLGLLVCSFCVDLVVPLQSHTSPVVSG